MWKGIAGIILLCCHGLAAQQREQHSSVLVRTFYKGDFLHANNEAAIDLRQIAGKPEDRVAVRICSREPMPLALAIASGRPFLLSSNLANYGYSQERILFLRSNKCDSFDTKIAITEFWAIPKGASLPSFVEVLSASQVQIKEYTATRRSAKTTTYAQQVVELADDLRSNPNTVGIAIGYYYKRPNGRLKQRLQNVAKSLKALGLPANRVYYRLLPWSGTIDSGDKEPEYPSLFSVSLKAKQ